jgi:hypothetical protein
MNKLAKSQADIPTMPSPDLEPTSTRDSSLESLRNLGQCMLDRYEVDARGEQPKTTLVFVLGAEASRASCLQDWKSFGRSLVDDLSGHYVHNEKDAFLDDALTRLQPLIGPASGNLNDKKNFLKKGARPEQIFEVACRNTIFEEKVRSKLADAYGPGRAPQLGYELVAHFLRHRFIDHVVNFNWDEILDRAIEDEVGPSGYERVLPDDRTPASAESRERPRLFKLHGTASAPGSLRFTTAETGLLSLTTMEQLDEALFGIRTSDDDPAPSMRSCHLVSFGYGWSDPDFVNYVIARWKRFERLTVVRLGQGYPSEVKRLFLQAYKKDFWESDRGRGKIAVVSADQLADAASGGTPLVDHVLWSLWELLYRDAREGARRLRLTPAARHILLGLYFAPVRNTFILPLVREDKDYRDRVDPLFDHSEPQRLLIEFLLHVMKSNGMINLSPMGQDPRIAGALARASGAQPLYDLLDNPNVFEPSPGSAMRETYFLLPAPQDQGVQAPTSSILKAAADTVAKALGVHSMTNLTFKPVWTDNDDLTFQKIEFGALFHECARQIFEADDVEVTAAGDSRNDVLFIAPRALTSWARLSGESSTLLAQPWDVLLVIAESGRWIFNALAELELLSGGARPAERRQIFLVRTSDRDLEKWQIGKAYDVDIERQIEELSSKGIMTRSVAIPWWRHNRHMTLTLHSKGEHYRLGKGIYFRRRLKNHRIAPVLVDDHQSTGISDRFELLLLFLSYASRAADSYRNSAANRSAGSEETRKDFEDLKDFAHQLMLVVSRIDCADERYRTSRTRLCEEIEKKILLLRQGLGD